MTDTGYQKVRCPHCQRKLKAPNQFIGQRAKCPQCTKPFVFEAIGEFELVDEFELIDDDQPTHLAETVPPSAAPIDAVLPTSKRSDSTADFFSDADGLPATAHSRAKPSVKQPTAPASKPANPPAARAKQSSKLAAKSTTAGAKLKAKAKSAKSNPFDDDVIIVDDDDLESDVAIIDDNAEDRFDFDKPKKKKKSKRTSHAANFAFEGNLVYGMILAIVAGVLGGVIWMLISKTTGLRLDFFAWVVGMMVGVGMAFGSQSHDSINGLFAAIICFGSILVSKVLLIKFILMWALLGDQPLQPQTLRETLIEQRAEEILETKNVDEDDEKAYAQAEIEAKEQAKKELAGKTDSQLERTHHEKLLEEEQTAALDSSTKQGADAIKQIKLEISAMTDQALSEKAQKLKARADAELKENRAELDKFQNQFMPVFLLFAFGIGGIIWTVLGCATAYKVAAGVWE